MYNPLPNFIILKPSSIHGYGLFAKSPIDRGTIVGISHVQHDLFPDGWIRTPLGGFYNHSETPNCELVEQNMDDGFITGIKLLRAITNIPSDTELTCTYTLWKITPEMMGDRTIAITNIPQILNFYGRSGVTSMGLTFEEACRDTVLRVAQVIIAKQHDYGHDNILAFKEQGLVVRLWDKISRLKNLLWKNAEPKNESIEDTFTDIAGYAIIGLMLAEGTFTNELKEEGG